MIVHLCSIGYMKQLYTVHVRLYVARKTCMQATVYYCTETCMKAEFFSFLVQYDSIYRTLRALYMHCMLLYGFELFFLCVGILG